MYLKLAWRNIWRNRQRTAITITFIFLAVLLAVIMRSAQTGVYDNMIRNVAGVYTGYVQVHQKGYWEEQTIDNSFKDDPQIIDNLLNKDGVRHVAPRLEAFALVASGDNTRGTMVTGISPVKEKEVTGIDVKIAKGSYFQHDDEKSVLIGEGLASILKLDLNDTLILLGQGYHGVSAAGKYPIKGIIQFGSPELSKNLIYLPIRTAQYLYGADSLLTSMVLDIEDPSEAEKIAKELKSNSAFGNYEIMNWKELMPELVQFIEADSAGGIIFIGVLYMVIAFGVFGTLLMMTNERMHEFGIITAIGMKRYKLAFIVFIETIILSFIGVFAGALLSLPVVFYFADHPYRFTGEIAEVYEQFGIEPILPMSTDLSLFTSQALAVFVIAVILFIYPFVKIMRLNAINALRS